MITGLSYKNLEDGKDNSNQMSQNPIQLELQKEQICCNIFLASQDALEVMRVTHSLSH